MGRGHPIGESKVPFPELVVGITKRKVRHSHLVNGVNETYYRRVDIAMNVYRGVFGRPCHSCFQRGVERNIIYGEIYGCGGITFSDAYCYECVTVHTVKKNLIVAKCVYYKPKRKLKRAIIGVNMNEIHFVGTQAQLNKYCKSLEEAGYPVVEIRDYQYTATSA
jgi:hypothetical protein